MKIIKNITLYESQNDYCAWPSVVRAADGSLLVSFCRTEQHMSPNGEIVIIRSMDNGETWSDAVAVNNTDIDNRHCGLTVLNDGDIMASLGSRNWTKEAYEKIMGWNNADSLLVKKWISYIETLDKREAESLEGYDLAVSSDSGHTWNGKIRTDLPTICFSHGGIQLSDDSLLFAFRLKEEGVGIFISKDKLHWERQAVITSPEPDKFLFDEPHVLCLSDGRIIVMMRVTSTPYDNSSELCHLWQSFSDDGGQTWAKPEKTPMWGFPPHLLLLSDNQVLCTYGYRRKPYGQRACISKDGLSWDVSNEFVIRNDAPDEDMGYAASIELERGKILTVYYQAEKSMPAGEKFYAKPKGYKPMIMGTIWTY